MLTNEEISCKIRDHLTAQRARSMNKYDFLEEECAYRGAEGRMCAVGVLIPDEDYDAEFEGCGIGVCPTDPRWEKLAGVLRARYGTHISFRMLWEWQRYHDSSVQGGGMYKEWCEEDNGISPFEFHKHLEAKGMLV